MKEYILQLKSPTGKLIEAIRFTVEDLDEGLSFEEQIIRAVEENEEESYLEGEDDDLHY